MENSFEYMLEISEDNFKNKILLCELCENILIDPYECSNCACCFCKECISSLEKEYPNCPNCLQIATFSPSQLMTQFLSLFKYKCIFGCGDDLTYNDLKTHLEKCSKINIKQQYEDIQKEKIELEKQINSKEEEFKDIFGKIRPSNLVWRGRDWGIGPTSEMYYISEIHPHPLYRIPLRAGSCTCDMCNKSIRGLDVPYSCVYCDFDYCCDCQRNEVERNKEIISAKIEKMKLDGNII